MAHRFYTKSECRDIRPGQIRKLDLIDDCWIPLHEDGTYGYVLCRLIAMGGHNDCKFIVYSKGVGECENILLDDLLQFCHGRPLKIEVVGAGLIENNIDDKTLKVWGSRPYFPKPDHSITANLLRKFAPHYNIITWSNGEKPVITRKESVKVVFVPEPAVSDQHIGFEPAPDYEESEEDIYTADLKQNTVEPEPINEPEPTSEPEPEPTIQEPTTSEPVVEEPTNPEPTTPEPQPEQDPTPAA